MLSRISNTSIASSVFGIGAAFAATLTPPLATGIVVTIGIKVICELSKLYISNQVKKIMDNTIHSDIQIKKHATRFVVNRFINPDIEVITYKVLNDIDNRIPYKTSERNDKLAGNIAQLTLDETFDEGVLIYLSCFKPFLKKIIKRGLIEATCKDSTSLYQRVKATGKLGLMNVAGFVYKKTKKAKP